MNPPPSHDDTEDSTQLFRHTRWSDAALEQFVLRFEDYIKNQASWSSQVRKDLDSLLADRDKIMGGKTALLWVAAVAGSLAAVWAFIQDHLHITIK